MSEEIIPVLITALLARSSFSGKAVVGAAVSIGNLSAKTDAQGSFRLADVPRDGTIKVTADNYEAGQVKPSEEALTIRLKPIPVSGGVTENLNGAVIQAMIEGAEATQTATDGSFELYGVGPGSEVTFTAPGYEALKIAVDESRRVTATLLADPATTLKQLAKWESEEKLDKTWEWMHPDVSRYATKEEYLKGVMDAHAGGYVTVGVDVHEMTFTVWTLNCRKNGRTVFSMRYENAATLRVTNHYSAPGGGAEDKPGVSHLVRTDDGKWRWFTIGNCE